MSICFYAHYSLAHHRSTSIQFGHVANAPQVFAPFATSRDDLLISIANTWRTVVGNDLQGLPHLGNMPLSLRSGLQIFGGRIGHRASAEKQFEAVRRLHELGEYCRQQNGNSDGNSHTVVNLWTIELADGFSYVEVRDE